MFRVSDSSTYEFLDVSSRCISISSSLHKFSPCMSFLHVSVYSCIRSFFVSVRPCIRTNWYMDETWYWYPYQCLHVSGPPRNTYVHVFVPPCISPPPFIRPSMYCFSLFISSSMCQVPCVSDPTMYQALHVSHSSYNSCFHVSVPPSFRVSVSAPGCFGWVVCVCTFRSRSWPTKLRLIIGHIWYVSSNQGLVYVYTS